MKLGAYAWVIFAVASLVSWAAEPMKISSPAFSAGGEIPAKYTCNGPNLSPELQISGAPAGGKSLLLVMDDPDAPTGLFTHWLAWNIDPHTTKFAENSVPAGAVQGTNDFGKRGYGGPCPPSGTHRYYFKIFALDTRHVIWQRELMARYSHK